MTSWEWENVNTELLPWTLRYWMWHEWLRWLAMMMSLTNWAWWHNMFNVCVDSWPVNTLSCHGHTLLNAQLAFVYNHQNTPMYWLRNNNVFIQEQHSIYFIDIWYQSWVLLQYRHWLINTFSQVLFQCKQVRICISFTTKFFELLSTCRKFMQD